MQIERQYLQRFVSGVGTLMDPIEEAIRETFSPALFGGEEINTNFWKLLGHSVKHGRLGILDPRSSEACAYNTSKADHRELVGSLLGGNALNYVGHMACVRGARAGTRKDWQYVEMEYLAI